GLVPHGVGEVRLRLRPARGGHQDKYHRSAYKYHRSVYHKYHHSAYHQYHHSAYHKYHHKAYHKYHHSAYKYHRSAYHQYHHSDYGGQFPQHHRGRDQRHRGGDQQHPSRDQRQWDHSNSGLDVAELHGLRRAVEKVLDLEPFKTFKASDNHSVNPEKTV
ncbi:uncharacterized histidine-rich protein DDB_G0274557, partial [Frankliniella occidentalis]|uniref:Uncharacterized histidine-rich protein DDB_G0274557 n=1 Tax=Frankliniella occidentalis TaxID=133901 RepID=A0A9C6X9U8_FRAOC